MRTKSLAEANENYYKMTEESYGIRSKKSGRSGSPGKKKHDGGKSRGRGGFSQSGRPPTEKEQKMTKL